MIAPTVTGEKISSSGVKRKPRMTKSKEVEVSKPAPPPAPIAASTTQAQDWGDDEFTSNDVRISKVFPMQQMSKKVQDELAVIGELRDSITNEFLGSISKPMPFIPINVKKVWVESELEGTAFEYRRTVPITRENENARYEDEINGKKIKRVRTLNVLVLLPGDVKAGFPKIISFRSSSLPAGKDVVSQIHKNKLTPGGGNADKVMLLTVRKDKNEKGTFVVLGVSEDRDTTALERERAFHWANAFMGGTVKVHEAEDVVSQEEVLKSVDGGPQDY